MSLIMGLEHDGDVWMGTDSGCWGDFLNPVLPPKVWQWGDVLVGGVGRTQFVGALRTGDFPPDYIGYSAFEDIERYLVREFVPHCKEVLSQAGVEPKKGRDSGGALIVAVSGVLADIANDWSVEIVSRPYLGQGAPTAVAVAYGSLWETRDSPDPQDRLVRALEAAEGHTDAVRRPFVVRRLERAARDSALAR